MPAEALSPERGSATIRGGVVAGVIGGIVISIFMFGMALMKGEDIWIGAKVAGYPFLGESVFRPGFEIGPVLLGVACHFAVSIVWGVLFALFAHGASVGGTVAGGAAWGIVVWLGMYYIVLPVVGAGHLARMTPVPMAIFEHVLFGLAVGFGYLPYQEPMRISRRYGEGAAPAMP